MKEFENKGTLSGWCGEQRDQEQGTKHMERKDRDIKKSHPKKSPTQKNPRPKKSLDPQKNPKNPPPPKKNQNTIFFFSYNFFKFKLPTSVKCCIQFYLIKWHFKGCKTAYKQPTVCLGTPCMFISNTLTPYLAAPNHIFIGANIVRAHAQAHCAGRT